MADVFGTIGNEQVELNNAATEATLRLLLQTTIAMAKGNKEEINKIATKAGLDPQAVQAANQQLTPLAKSAQLAGGAFVAVKNDLSALGGKFVEGTAQTSDVFSALAKLPFGIGLVAQGFAALAKFQEENFRTYQQISSVGVNFAGSLTDMRLAAAETQMTLSKFGEFINRNGEELKGLGGSTNEGAMAFRRLSKEILTSSTGNNLKALGFSAEQVNQGMLDFIATTGGRSKRELGNTDAIREGTAAYLEQLDRLADITGKNREEQEKQHKQAMFEADVQATMAKMTEKDRIAFSAAMKEAGALHGQAGRDIVLAQAQGRAVTGEAGKMLMATAPAAATAVQSMQSTAKQFGASSKEFASVSNKSVLEAQRAFKSIDPAIISTNKQLGVLSDSFKTAYSTQMSGLDSQEAFDKREEDRRKKVEEVLKSEAKSLADADTEMKKFTAAVIGLIGPIVSLLTPALTIVARVFGTIGDLFNKIESPIAKTAASFGVLATVVAGYLLIKKRQVAEEAAKTALSAAPTPGSVATKAAGSAAAGAGGLGASIGASLKGLAGGLGALANPMTLIGLGALTLSIIGLSKAFEIASPGFDGFGKMVKSIFEGLGGIIVSVGTVISSVFSGLSDGIIKMSVVDPLKLIAIGGGVGALGLAFAPFSVFGGLAALSVNSLADGLLKITTVDAGKLERVAAAMEKVNAATPTVGQTLRAGLSNVVGKLTGAPAAGENAAANPATPGMDLNILTDELRRLNSISAEILKNSRDSVDQLRRNVDATRSLNGNLFPTP